MALAGYKRILYIDNLDSVLTSATDTNNLCNYIQSHGFNGTYIRNFQTAHTNQGDAAMAGFISRVYTSGSTLIGAICDSSADASYIDSVYSNSGRPAPEKITGYVLDNNYWDSAPGAAPTWYNELVTVDGSFPDLQSKEFLIGYYENFSDLFVTDIEFSSLQLQSSDKIHLSAFDLGIPLYGSVNNTRLTQFPRQRGRLDIIATAAASLNATASVYVLIDLQEVDLGGTYNRSGKSLTYAGDYDTFELQLIKSINHRMTATQKGRINIQGFAYSNSQYAMQQISTVVAAPTGSSTPDTGSYRILKIDNFNTRLASPTLTQEMYDFISLYNFNWIQLYDLAYIFPSEAGSNAMTASMATFISKSRTLGVSRVGAIRGTSQTRWNHVFSYNSQHPWYAHFDDFNIEDEFWNNQGTAAATWFDWSSSGNWLRSQMNTVYNKGAAYTASGGNSWVISAYCQGGKQSPPSSQRWYSPYITASIIVNIVDVYEATNYNSGQPDWTSIYAPGAHPQIEYIASASFLAGKITSFVPIFSLEMVAYGAANNFEGSYFRATGIPAAEAAWSGGFNAATASVAFPHASSIKQIGFNYFDLKWVSASLGL